MKITLRLTIVSFGLAMFVVSSSLAQSSDCSPVSAGLLGWWQGEYNGNDYMGTNNGTGDATFVPAKVSQGFAFNGFNQVVVPNGIGLNPSHLTLEAWINPQNYPQDIVSVITKENSFTRVQYQIGFVYIDRWLFRCLIDVPAGYAYVDTVTPIQTDKWYHVAMTYDGAALRVYLNGTLEASSYALGGIVTGDEPLYFGAERSWWHFTGWLDEISLYSHALSAEELGALYAAGSTGKCPRVPVIVSPPRSQVAYWGKDVTLTVTARGEPPLNYYWFKDGNPIQIPSAGSLMLTNIQATDTGVYSAIVSNRNGTVTSTSAILTVNPYGVSLDLYAGLTINGMMGATYGIQESTNPDDPLGWRGVTNVTLSSPEQLWLNSQPATQSRRFYRVLPGPISIP